MLGIHGVGRDRADYYLSDLARELPLSGAGCWVGTAAAAIGLAGGVEPDAFRRLLQGRHPGHRAGPRVRPDLGGGLRPDLQRTEVGQRPVRARWRGHRAGRGGAPRRGRCRCPLVPGAARGHRSPASGPDRVVLPTSGAVAAQFTHGVSRNGDPHVHSHVVMANLVHGADGRWGACDRRGLAAHRLAASAVYEAHLRAGLASALGVRWTAAPGRTAEIVGVGPELLGEFSTRAADIRRHMHEAGARSGRGARVAWAATRPAKVPAAPVRRPGRRRGRSGPVRPALSSTSSPGRPSGRAVLDEHRFAGVISLTAHGGARRRDVVDRIRCGGPGRHLRRRPRTPRRPLGAAGPGGVAEPVLQRRQVVPANHLLQALGPRPVDPGEHEVWLGAARAVDAYRERWGLGRAAEPLGTAAGTGLAALPADRLADHVRTERQLRLPAPGSGGASP